MIDTVDGIEGLAELLEAMAETIENGSYEHRMDELVPLIQDCEAKAFHEGREPGRTPWAPLAPSTIARKGARSGIIGPHSTILVDTGRLFESLTIDDGTSDTVWITGDNFLTFGTSVPYSIFHETGTSRMPARPAVGVNDETVDLIGAMVAGFVADKMGGVDHG
jgi:phage gpG-like protein